MYPLVVALFSTKKQFLIIFNGSIKTTYFTLVVVNFATQDKMTNMHNLVIRQNTRVQGLGILLPHSSLQHSFDG